MSVFRHPCLTRGIVQTVAGAFFISRSLVEAPDEVGDLLGWRRVSVGDPAEMASPTTPPAAVTHPADRSRRI
jgi:hypothetical protein